MMVYPIFFHMTLKGVSSWGMWKKIGYTIIATRAHSLEGLAHVVIDMPHRFFCPRITQDGIFPLALNRPAVQHHEHRFFFFGKVDLLRCHWVFLSVNCACTSAIFRRISAFPASRFVPAGGVSKHSQSSATVSTNSSKDGWSGLAESSRGVFV